jgi:hypothetical protein
MKNENNYTKHQQMILELELLYETELQNGKKFSTLKDIKDKIRALKERVDLYQTENISNAQGNSQH